MNKIVYFVVFAAAAKIGATYAESPTSAPGSKQEAECTKYVGSALQADEMMNITIQTKGSNSELVSKLRAQKVNECEIKAALQKKLFKIK